VFAEVFRDQNERAPQGLAPKHLLRFIGFRVAERLNGLPEMRKRILQGFDGLRLVGGHRPDGVEIETRWWRGPERTGQLLDILLTLKDEDSYGAGFWSLRWVPPTTALVQRRTTKRLYFWAGRPKVLFEDERVYDESEEKAKRKPYFPGLKTPRLYG
jgi:hypothetical protein